MASTPRLADDSNADVLAADAPLPADSLPAPRPHLLLTGSMLVSVTTGQALQQLSPAQVQCWKLVQGSASIGAIRERLGRQADTLVRDFLRHGLCELIDPSFPKARRRVLVLEPHADDAILSVGGTMWLRRRECAFVIATVASRSNHTRYRDMGYELDIDTATEMRRRESQLVARVLGGEHVSLGMTDAALRYYDHHWSSDFYRRHRLSINASTSRVADAVERGRWIGALQRLLADETADEIWFPMGGLHTDHMLTADACLAAFAADPGLARGRTVRLYQESPYQNLHPRRMHAVVASLRRAGAELDEERVAIASVREQKRRLAAIYDSQNMQELWSSGGHDPTERFWVARELPRHGTADGIVSGALIEQFSLDASAAWLERNRDAQRLRVLLSAPTGRWVADLEFLGTAFPRARFEVVVAASAKAEVADVTSDRVEMRTVAGGTLAWLVECLRVCVSRPAPTLFYAGDRRWREARVLSVLWLGSDTLVVYNMDQVASARLIAPGGG